MEMSLYQYCSAFHVHTGDVPSLGGFFALFVKKTIVRASLERVRVACERKARKWERAKETRNLNNHVLSFDSAACCLRPVYLRPCIKHATRRISCRNTLDLLFVLLLALLKPSLLCAEVRFADRQQFSSTFSLRSSHLGRAIPILVHSSTLFLTLSRTSHVCRSSRLVMDRFVFCTLPQICLSISEVMQPCQIEPSPSPRRVCEIHMSYRRADSTICGSSIKQMCLCLCCQFCSLVSRISYTSLVAVIFRKCQP